MGFHNAKPERSRNFGKLVNHYYFSRYLLQVNFNWIKVMKTIMK